MALTVIKSTGIDLVGVSAAIGGPKGTAATFPSDNTTKGTAALPNTGGGGGSRQWFGTDGGSGVVIVRYQI